MTKDELITKQQLEIETLKEQVAAHKDREQQVFYVLYSIGAPLNDNKLRFSKEQLGPFFQISNILGL